MTRHFLRLLGSALMLTLLILVSAQAQTSQASETAAPAPPPTTTKWSPHSKPFDLVWDVNNEDYNLLPRNPQWAQPTGKFRASARLHEAMREGAL
jgi:hypothetical protein